MVLPVLFLVSPTASILASKATAGSQKLDTQVGLSLMILMLIPVILPSTMAANSVIGGREQGTLEPALTTPIRREELLIGKAVATFIPAVALSYLVFGAFAMRPIRRPPDASGNQRWMNEPCRDHRARSRLCGVGAQHQVKQAGEAAVELGAAQTVDPA